MFLSFCSIIEDYISSGFYIRKEHNPMARLRKGLEIEARFLFLEEGCDADVRVEYG